MKILHGVARKGSGQTQIPKNKLAKGLAIVKTGGCLTPDPLRGIGSEANTRIHIALESATSKRASEGNPREGTTLQKR